MASLRYAIEGPTLVDRSAALEVSDDITWDAFVAAATRPSYLQTSAWATVKRLTGWDAWRVLAQVGDEACGRGTIGAQVLVARPRLSPWAIGYVPRGPIATIPLHGAALGAFTASLRGLAIARGLAYVRMEPDLAIAEGLEPDLGRLGWRRAAHVQPDRSRVIDASLGERRLWRDLRPKWRQYVRQAVLRGVTVTEGGRDDLPDFYRILRQTSGRCGFPIRTLESYRAVWDGFAPSGSATLLFARESGAASSVLLLVRCGDHMTELYGGMTAAAMRSRSNYLLKWEAIRRAAAEGMRTYDMWGLPTPGIEQFKTGFGGSTVEYVGAWELPISHVGRATMTVGQRLRDASARAIWAISSGHRAVREDVSEPGGPERA